MRTLVQDDLFAGLSSFSSLVPLGLQQDKGTQLEYLMINGLSYVENSIKGIGWHFFEIHVCFLFESHMGRLIPLLCLYGIYEEKARLLRGYLSINIVHS